MENDVMFTPCSRCKRLVEDFHGWRYQMIDDELVCIHCLASEEGVFIPRHMQADFDSYADKKIKQAFFDMAEKYLERSGGN